MNRVIWMLAAAGIAGCAAQQMETRAEPATTPTPIKTEPAPAPAPAKTEPMAKADPAPVTDGDVTEAWLNGMQILVKKNPHAELVAGQLALKGGVFNWDATNAGVEQLALSAATNGGTQKLDKDAFARRLATIGSSVGGGAGGDFSLLSFKSLLQNWEETFQLMADTLVIPALPDSEIELQRTQQLQGLRREQENPDSRLSLLAHKRIFAGHPYANRSIGTLETVPGLTRAQLEAHLGKLRETSRLVLVVVGNVDAAQVIAAARRAFGGLPRGSYQDTEMPPVRFEAATVDVQDEKLPTNYITGIFPAPSWKEREFPAAMVAINALHDRLWDEVRSKRNLSYAPGAGLTMNSRVPRGSLYVTAVDPNTTIKVMLDESRRLATELLPPEDLAGSKETYRTSYLMRNETTDGQAAMLMRSQLYGGDWRLFREIPKRISEVTSSDVQQFARKYISHLRMFVVGDPAKVDPALFQSL